MGLEYDPDNDGPLPKRTLQICINPQFDAAGLVTSATIPTGETWCLASALSVGSATPGEINTLYQVYGEEDPSFSPR